MTLARRPTASTECSRAPGRAVPAADRRAASARRADVLVERRPTRPASPPTAGCGAAAFVDEQGLFAGHDRDDVDDDPRHDRARRPRPADGDVLGGVRLTPPPATAGELGWWRGQPPGRGPGARRRPRAAPRWCAPPAPGPRPRARCASTPRCRPTSERFFARLGWRAIGTGRRRRGRPHVLHALARSTASRRRPRAQGSASARLLGGAAARAAPASSATTAPRSPAPTWSRPATRSCPSMVERDPGWAGWCSVLVNVNDLAAMGATPVGLLDAVAGAPTPSLARRVAAPGWPRRPSAYGVPVLGGHTQLGVPAVAVGHRARPHRPTRCPAAAAGPATPCGWSPTSAAAGGPGYAGRQWDSHHRPHARRAAPPWPATLQPVHRPAAAKDVSHGRAGRHARHAGRGQRAAAPSSTWPPCPGPARRRAGRLAHLLPRLRPGHRRPTPGDPAEVAPATCRLRPPGRRRRRRAALARRRARPRRRRTGHRPGRRRRDCGAPATGAVRPRLRRRPDRRTVARSGWPDACATLAIAAVAAPFGRDLEAGLATIDALLDEARGRGARPAWCCPRPRSAATSPTCQRRPDRAAAAAARPRRPRDRAASPTWPATWWCASGSARPTATAATTPRSASATARSSAAPQGPPAARARARRYGAGDRFAAFDTPVGRIGMLIC